MTSTNWFHAPLAALDLEGTGGQDKDHEAILEIATVRLIDGRPDYNTAFHTLINPGRPVPHRPWISPGITDADLTTAPTTAEVGARLKPMVHGCYLVGHNVRVDWKLLHRHYPTITIAGLIDTLRLARTAVHGVHHSLTSLLDHFALTDEVTAATGSRPHRALWDTVGTALLLPTLVQHHWAREPTLTTLLGLAGIPADSHIPSPPGQPALFDLDAHPDV
ncbi:3'-5' exonuclease [Catenuloplanes atrovinosus]|uniref:DNA polymerase III epsilon subunit-like protein n=1 Tax=Catenuloplanes atrovinosus TaxID=137266 RepID=A0AAE4CB47_9ACTN|nr:3'-5' exonuclease [Catenuloplanes atrovinosus]MDR7277723.1 DNA polymerase III epsilon subunit-like protein [Catenuloplanes atrovinosus]